jgi:nucleoside triphosphate diphosphatase
LHDEALGRALALVRDLRARCPWDKAQTPETLRPYLVEEALELDQAIAGGDRTELRGELGDVLLHLAFQIVIAEEREWFDAESVTRGLEEKMWRRHPHLFGGGAAPQSWERGKREAGGGATGTLAGLPPALPALLKAYRLQERAAGVGFDWPDAAGPTAKVREEIDELDREAKQGNRDGMQDEVGDLLFAVVNLSRKLGIDPRAALEGANAKFTRRFEGVERLAGERGIDLGEAGLEVLDGLWDEVKGGA